jgi:hypothetical protein
MVQRSTLGKVFDMGCIHVIVKCFFILGSIAAIALGCWINIGTKEMRRARRSEYFKDSNKED